MVDHFMQFGYCVVKQAFTQDQAREVAGDVWIRLGMDPDDSSTWDKVGVTNAERSSCMRAGIGLIISSLFCPQTSNVFLVGPPTIEPPKHPHLELVPRPYLAPICIAVGTDQHAQYVPSRPARQPREGADTPMISVPIEAHRQFLLKDFSPKAYRVICEMLVSLPSRQTGMLKRG